jgi:hypothetical protein
MDQAWRMVSMTSTPSPLAEMLLRQLARTFPEQAQVAAYVEPSSKEIT